MMTDPDPLDYLPLSFTGSEPIPPSPTSLSESVSFLHDFAGHSWVAYGAASLLIISHFPNPCSSEETLIGPILRQTFELSGNDGDYADVAAVDWSPKTPSSGEVAAACENCVFVFANESAEPGGSFCWSQNAVLVQSTKVEAIKWTGSGDGIVAGGIEVLLWKYRNRAWEIAWKFKADQPQTMVATSWLIGGPSASVAHMSEMQSEDRGKCVSVYYGDSKHGYTKAELHHPQSVTFINWRQSLGRWLNSDVHNFSRNVLLTCCLDGTARLWCEIYDGRSRKIGKDNNDHKKIRRTFSVAAVIDVNRVLSGSLGNDVFMTWATEIKGIFRTSDGGNKFFSNEEYDCDNVGACEWLISFGPGMLVSYWPVHCLDDISPMRFPRVILWKKQELKPKYLDGTDFLKTNKPLLLNKAIIARKCFSGPPALCSLLYYIPGNSMAWSMLHSQLSNSTDESSIAISRAENLLSCSATGMFKLSGHTGKILQVAIHPHSCEVELAASLDSNGKLLFWSLSNTNVCNVGLPNLLPGWELCGQLETRDFCPKYTSLRWAPSAINEDQVLFMGHVKGIDCFIVKFSQSNEENIKCHHFCTIPFTGHGPYEDGPIDVFTIPLDSKCTKAYKSSKFLLLGVWMKSFEALSWEIKLHTYESPESCTGLNVGNDGVNELNMYKFESTFAGRNYCIGVDPCSSCLPDPHANDKVTSFSVAFSTCLTLMQQSLGSNNDLCHKYPAYVMATGCADGSLKLWKTKKAKPTSTFMPWELVGILRTHPGPVLALSLSDNGQKIATVSRESHSDSISLVKIWDAVHLTGGGSYVLEDTITLDRDVVALKWLTLGNGQSLLGICMKNELQVYAQRRCAGQALLSAQKAMEVPNWSCVASAHTLPCIHDFVWGLGATAIIIHYSYFSLYSRSLFLPDKSHNSKSHLPSTEALSYEEEMRKDVLSSIFIDNHIDGYKELSLGGDSGKLKSGPHANIDIKENLHSSFSVAWARLRCGPLNKHCVWSMPEVVERLGGSLPVYHPQALLMNICSGNWKRATISLKHLFESLSSMDSHKRNGSENFSYVIPQILPSKYFEQTMTSSTDRGFQWGSSASLITSSSHTQTGDIHFGSNLDSATSSDIFIPSSTQSKLGDLGELLEKYSELAAITILERLQILAIVDLLSEVSDTHSACAYASLDEPGRRFWVALRFQQLLFSRKFDRKPAVEELFVDSGLIGWAVHSDCQETLLGSFLSSEPSWQEMRSAGAGYWFTNETELRKRMEKLARMQYLKKKDPKDCTLLYVALNRIQVLAGLFKVSKNEKDKPLVGFLSRNFQEEKNKAAALKNAYVLLSKHQFELAIAFFLLGGDTVSAVTVCAKNLGDEQLALVICRLVEGRGGELHRHLITKIILPLAREKSDYWLASLLEWELGNYSQSFLCMMGFHTTSVAEKLAISTNHIAFVDPNIGLYCLTLATKSKLKSALGEQNAAILLMWANFMTATALKRSGLTLEALECFSAPLSAPGVADLGSVSDSVHSEVLPGVLKPCPSKSSGWLLHDVAMLLESYAKSDLALHYLSKLIREHPNWSDTLLKFPAATICSEEYGMIPYEKLHEDFRLRLYTILAEFEQKFSVKPFYLLNMASLYLCNIGRIFIAYDMLNGYASQEYSQNDDQFGGSCLLYPCPYRPLLRATKEFSFLSSRFIVACSISDTHLSELGGIENEVSGGRISKWSDVWRYYLQDLLLLCQNLRASLRIARGSLTDDLALKPQNVLDLFEYYMFFSSAWLHRNPKVILLMFQPLLSTFIKGHSPYEVDIAYVRKFLRQNERSLDNNLSKMGAKDRIQMSSSIESGSGDNKHSIPVVEQWQIIGACMWQHMFRFLKHQPSLDCEKLSNDHFNESSCGTYLGSWSGKSEPDTSRVATNLGLISMLLMKLLKATLTHLSSFQIKQLALFLREKVENGQHPSTLLWLERSDRSCPTGLDQYLEGCVNLDELTSEDDSSNYEALRKISDDLHIIDECFVQESIDWSNYFKRKASKGWTDYYKYISDEHRNEDSGSHDGKMKGSPAKTETGSYVQNLSRPSHTSVLQRDTILTDGVNVFHKPKEVYKRNGELLEALCTNSINQPEAAIASNRKGIVFFNWDDGMPSIDQADYIWSDADWPHNGWAGSHSTPVPTCVSPGVGLGSNKGAHLGLGGATIGTRSLARPVRTFSGTGAFGIPGYAGIGASGLGWEVQVDFEEFSDPPATVENIVTRAFSSHPSRPLFLVGSVNTHIYLWEFGKDKATSTYGVLPAANVPPPYALASISALQFDHCGHRFASAALDGTICTWQLEVGGRSNIHPTESSLCFNNHARDVTFVTSSGSIVAAAGYSSNGVNVVVWDTLAPPMTARASIICHEGGARSISVFDNDIGSGSVSPFIVTGGKTGDVALHDFRYIATGKTKRHRHPSDNEQSTNASSVTNMRTGPDNKHGDQNVNGMLWYIPKAHTGNVAKIATVPNTSLFLTGSKDGDVKLWDAKKARLVHHWPKLHERHTFLQPSSSRGFGEVVRAAVTDIQVVSHGFLTCGGDGSVKLIRFQDNKLGWKV